jgi:cyclopropane-fatty-acyl-phospholipid synthase
LIALPATGKITLKATVPSGGHEGVARVKSRNQFSSLLREAGVAVGGGKPWDLDVRNERLYSRVLAGGTLAVGESYMDGWWEVERLDEFFARVLRVGLDRRLVTLPLIAKTLRSRLGNLQGRRRSRRVAEQHYDLSNELYAAMLGPTMQYTCAYYGAAGEDLSLDAAQQRKLELIARKLHLRPGLRVLELGGGFGELARFLAERHGCEVVSYNISERQVEWARERCRGLPVEFRLKDYREAAADPMQYDRVVSVGLMEHVGPHNHRGFFELARARLAPGGLCLMHTIGRNTSRTMTDPWIDKYIFPGGVIPSERQLTEAKEGLFVLEDWHNFGPDYDRTLLAWEANFRAAWPRLSVEGALDERFYRMWRFYLLSSAGAFRAHTLNLWQMVLSAGDVPRYTPVR